MRYLSMSVRNKVSPVVGNLACKRSAVLRGEGFLLGEVRVSTTIDGREEINMSVDALACNNGMQRAWMKHSRIPEVAFASMTAALNDCKIGRSSGGEKA